MTYSSKRCPPTARGKTDTPAGNCLAAQDRPEVFKTSKLHKLHISPLNGTETMLPYNQARDTKNMKG